MRARARNGTGAAAGAFGVLGAAWLAGCSTVLGIGDWTDLTTGGPDASTMGALEGGAGLSDSSASGTSGASGHSGTVTGTSGGGATGTTGAATGSSTTGSATGTTGTTTGTTGATSGSATGSAAGTTGTTTGTTGATSGSAAGTTGTTTGTTGATSGSATGSTAGTTGTRTGCATTGSTAGTTTGGTAGTTSGSGTVDAGGPPSCGTPGANVLSDFEQDTGILVPQGGRTGWWYVAADTLTGTQTPAASTGPIAVAAAPADALLGAGETCNRFSLASTASGHTMYALFGATFVPGTGTSKMAYDLSAFDGIQFDIKGIAAAPPMYFEILTQETQLTTLGGSLPTTANASVALNNTRGYYLSAQGAMPTSTSTSIPLTTTTVYVPFSLLIPRHLPPPSVCGTDLCQAPAFVPADAIGFQFSAYPDMNNTSGGYNLVVDNVALYRGDNGLNPASPTAATPAFNDGATGFAACKSAIPTFAGSRTAAGKYLQAAYNNWKGRFVAGTPGSARRVIRPEDGNDTVSEAIGYGMLLAVYFNDQSLFNDLWTYEQAHLATGDLMTACVPAGTGSCSGGSGTETDADEDMAFALIEAGKRWGGTYAPTAATVISNIAVNEIDFTTFLPKGGSNFASVNPTNPSYFAPAYYRIFATIDPNHNWTALAGNVISVLTSLASGVGGGDGLVPGWCTSNCTAVGSNGGVADGLYQYDAHRVPWRIGLDYCWNGTTAAQTYLNTLSTFFNGIYTSAGIDSIDDVYNLTGTPGSTAQPNSMSVVGTAAVGAMAGGAADAALVKAGWQRVLDGANRATLDVVSTGTSSYSYLNATVGLLTALTLSGNFYPM